MFWDSAGPMSNWSAFAKIMNPCSELSGRCGGGSVSAKRRRCDAPGLRNPPVGFPACPEGKIPAEHLSFFESLLPYYETDQYLFVHAGLRPGATVACQSARDLQWIRREFIDSEDDFGKRVVFGHTHFNAPLVAENKIGIDTGAVYGGSLTCVELPALKFYQVST